MDTFKNAFGSTMGKIAGCFGCLFLVIVVGVIITVANGGSKNITSDNSPHTVNASSSQSSTNTPTPTTQVFKVGDTIAIKDQTLKVNSVNLKYVPSNEFEQAAAGHQLVLVNITLHNNGSSSIDYSAGDFKIQDSLGGQTTSNTISSDSNELSSYASLATNGTATGDIVYNVLSANATNLKLIFQPSFWDNETATIALN